MARRMPALRRRCSRIVGARQIPRPAVRMLVGDGRILLGVSGPLAPDAVPLLVREIVRAAAMCHGEVVVDLTKAQVADADFRLLERLANEHFRNGRCSLRWGIDGFLTSGATDAAAVFRRADAEPA